MEWKPAESVTLTVEARSMIALPKLSLEMATPSMKRVMPSSEADRNE